RIAVFKFINKHLKNDTKTPVKDVDFKPIPGKELRVFPEDKDIPKDAMNAKIDETFVPRAKVELPKKGKFDDWKKEQLQKLRRACFQAFPDEIPAAKVTSRHADVSVYLATEPGIEVYAPAVALNENAKELTEIAGIVFGPPLGRENPNM